MGPPSNIQSELDWHSEQLWRSTIRARSRSQPDIELRHKSIISQRPLFQLQHLPPELIIYVADKLPTSDLFALLRTCKYHHSLLIPQLYQRAVHEVRPDVETPFQKSPTPDRTILHFAAAHNHLRLLTEILNRLSPGHSRTQLVNKPDAQGATPLTTAVLRGQTWAVRILLAAGAMMPRTYDGYVAMCSAAWFGNQELRRMLREYDDNSEQRNVFGLCSSKQLRDGIKFRDRVIQERRVEAVLVGEERLTDGVVQCLVVFKCDNILERLFAETQAQVMSETYQRMIDNLMEREQDGCKWCERVRCQESAAD